MSKTVEDVLNALLKLFQCGLCLLHIYYVPPSSIIPQGFGRPQGVAPTAAAYGALPPASRSARRVGSGSR